MTSSAKGENSAVPEESKPRATPVREHVKFLDGIRGLAALYVTVHHAYCEMGWNQRDQQLPPFLAHLMSFLGPGTYGVAMFIVLSGFCLMMPVVRSADLQLRGGAVQYIKRRAFRILPPYYAALGLSLLAYFCISGFRHRTGIQTQLSSCPTTDNLRWAILSHLGMFHNVSQVWAFKFNSPLWSVATEWQIYFLLPLLLLPIWKRFGAIATALSGWVVGLLPHFVFHGRYDAAAPWLIGLFALGMVGAGICYSDRSFETSLRERMSWGWLTVLSTALLLLLTYLPRTSGLWQQLEMLSGVPAMCLLIYCVLASRASIDRKPALIAFFESPFVVKLGAMSYSLYLTHILLVELVTLLLHRFALTPVQQLFAYLTLDTVLALGFAYVFYLVVERRFIKSS